MLPAALLGFLGTTLRVSYHVFYQTSYLHLKKSYTVNRITEDVKPEDRSEDRLTQALAEDLSRPVWMAGQVDVQARRVVAGRTASSGGTSMPAGMEIALGLRLSGLMGLGSELFILMLFSLVNRLDLYLDGKPGGPESALGL